MRSIHERRGLRFPVMTERTRLISCLLYGLFSVILKKNTIKKLEVVLHICLGAEEVIRGRVHGVETNLARRSKPQDTVSLTMRYFLSLLRQDLGQIQPLQLKKNTIFIMPGSLQENLALSAANQSARTIVAI